MTVLVPTQDDLSRMIDSNLDLLDSTKYQYKKAIRNYLYDRDPDTAALIPSGRSLVNRDQLIDYAATVSTSSRAFLKAALGQWTEHMAAGAKSRADGTVETVAKIQSTLWQLEAIEKAIKVKQDKGDKAHTWLKQSEVMQLIRTLGNDTAGRRDKAVIGLLVGAGLRRTETAIIASWDIIIQGNRVSLAVSGKGAKSRIVPISDELADILAAWRTLAGDGFIARSVTRGGAIGDSLSTIGIFKIVSKAGERIGKPDLAPHDLRRTYAQLGFEAGVPITQLSKLLGHASVATTQRYLNLDLDLETTASDFVPLG